MEQSNFSKIVNVLRIAYPYYFKDMEKESTIMFNQLYYSKLKKYDYVVVSSAINKIIEKSEFMPTIAEILTECDKETRRLYKIKIDKMYANGFFKTDQEYGKALQWLFEDKPIIPNWLLEEINGYKEKLLISKKNK
jgi:hypothetical protein